MDNILKLEQVDTAADQDLNLLIDQLSSTVPHNLDTTGSLSEAALLHTHKQTSASAPPTDDINAWVKDRQKKDNHNQSKLSQAVHCGWVCLVIPCSNITPWEYHHRLHCG